MGVPALFRWLSEKYPKIISPVIEEDPKEVDGVTVPVDTAKPNPNGEVSASLFAIPPHPFFIFYILYFIFYISLFLFLAPLFLFLFFLTDK